MQVASLTAVEDELATIATMVSFGERIEWPTTVREFSRCSHYGRAHVERRRRLAVIEIREWDFRPWWRCQKPTPWFRAHADLVVLGWSFDVGLDKSPYEDC